MLSLSSIFVLFSEIAMASIGSFAAWKFWKRLKNHKEKRYFYTLVIIGFSIGASQGFISFLTTILYILLGESDAHFTWAYIFSTTSLYNWIHWLAIVYLFTKKKHAWHNYVISFTLWVSAIALFYTPFTLINNQGIITPFGVNWGTISFSVENVVFNILIILYVFYHRHKLIKQGKPIGYINLLLKAFAFLAFAYTGSALYTLTNYTYPFLYIIAWVCGFSFVFSYFVGLIAVDDENEMLLFQPMLFIKRSIIVKLVMILSSIVWITVVGTTLVSSTLIDQTLKPYLGTPFIKEFLIKAVQAQAVFLIISVLILIITTIIIIYFIKTLLSPIDSLKQGAKNIGQGNLDYRITSITNDELGRLSMDFNEMASNLAKKNKEISRLKELDALKSQFISIASHQLRTPLTTMRWGLATLLDKDKLLNAKEQTTMISEVYKSTKRLINIVNDLLTTSKLESQIPLNKTIVSLIPLINNILEQLKSQLTDRAINVEFQYKNPNLKLTGDEALLSTALENIIANAIFYNKNGGRVCIAIRNRQKTILISVKDSGIGIREKDKVNIFSKFYRSQDAITQKTDGSGLGLFITRSIIASHKGKIWFTSEYGKGTEFFIELPKKLSNKSFRYEISAF